MQTILDRMRLERRITVVILVVLIAVALLYSLFFQSRGGQVSYMVDPAHMKSVPAQGLEE